MQIFLFSFKYSHLRANHTTATTNKKYICGYENVCKRSTIYIFAGSWERKSMNSFWIVQQVRRQLFLYYFIFAYVHFLCLSSVHTATHSSSFQAKKNFFCVKGNLKKGIAFFSINRNEKINCLELFPYFWCRKTAAIAVVSYCHKSMNTFMFITIHKKLNAINMYIG